MGEGLSAGEPIDSLLKSTQDLLRPEQLVREATRDIVKEEIRRHLEKTLQEDPKLAPGPPRMPCAPCSRPGPSSMPP